MTRALFPVRPSEKRDAIAAFAFLFVFVLGHSILEAARDALFLARIPNTRLPWVYVAIAVTALLATKAQVLFRRLTPRRLLVASTLLAGLGTAAICMLLRPLGGTGVYVFYVWSGVIATIVLVHYWSFIGGLFSVTQAKRLYGVIGLGSGAGAITGSAIAALAARSLSAPKLAMLAALAFLVASVLPAAFSGGAAIEVEPTRDSQAPQAALGERVGLVLRAPYVRRVIGVGMLVTIAVTISDFIFKSEIAAHVPKRDLAETFGTVNLGLNFLSLLVQLVGVRALVKRLPLPWVLAILPLGLALGGAGIALTGALGAAIFTKGVDGSIRFSVHRTASELLLVPLPENARRAAKSFADVLGQRGAQMIGSLIILACIALAVPERWLAVVLAVSALLAVLGAVRLRFDYIQLFKDFVTGRRRRLVGAFAHLDMASLEALLTSLDSESDDEIIAALRVLDREGKARVIPGSILYHPSEDVVVTALRIFALRGHRVTLHAIRHLEQHPSFRIRAEAIAARAVLSPDPEALAAHLGEERSPEVRAAIIATMASFSMMPENEARTALREIVTSGTAESRIVVAEVIGWRGARAFVPEILELAHAREIEVRRAAVSALGSLGGDVPARAIVDLLADPGMADDVHAAVVGAGSDGIAALEAALGDRERAKPVRRLVPALLADIDPDRAAGALLGNLAAETDGMVRYRSILALAHIVETRPEIHLDGGLLEGEIRRTIARAYRYIDRRLILARGAKEDPSRGTVGHSLLVDLLHDKERNTVGRLFRLLALAYPYEEFDAIYSSIESGRSDHRANALELIENVLDDPLRDAILGLVDDVPDDERLPRGEEFHQPLRLDYEAVVSNMLGSSSIVVRDFATYHIGELGLTSLRDRVQELMDGGRGTGDVARTLALLAGSKTAPPPSLRSNHVG